jgi:CBS domain containing-hemolysin-like protein
LNDVRQTFLETGYSRLPIYEKSLDEVIGVLFRKDLDMGRVTDETFEVKLLVRPAVFIPASSSLGDALRRMQASRSHFAFVVDEHGGTDGILTLEDLLEEIVGEIDDEFDEEAREQIKKDGETYILDGMLAVRDANKHFGLGLEEDGRYTTIAGFLLAKAGRLLRPGDRVEDDAGVFSVERVEDRRITRVRFRPANT